jgi:hypothetical protein
LPHARLMPDRDVAPMGQAKRAAPGDVALAELPKQLAVALSQPLPSLGLGGSGQGPEQEAAYLVG